MSRPFVRKDIPDFHEKYIALMSIEGAIIEGRNRQPLFNRFTLPFPFGLSRCAGDISVTATVKKIESDKNVAALLLYINSGGGSAAASEVMRSDLEKLARKIPVHVVMGPMAASGGYWIASAAHKIFAYPNTLTGSIGVLSGKFILKGFLKKLYLHREVIKQGKNALMFSTDTHFSEEQVAMIKNYIQRVYDLFLDRVSKCRSIDKKTVDSIAQGKVWTGLQALENRLIDGVGGFRQAIEEIKKSAGLKDSTPIQIVQPPRKNLLAAAAAADSMLGRYINILIKGEQSMNALCLCPFVEDY
jgi:protease-4